MVREDAASASLDLKNDECFQHLCLHADAEGGSDEVKEETVFAEADKRFLVQRLPPVLTLHLKRFEQRGMMRVTKNNRHVAFPRLLDMAPFCTCDSEVCVCVCVCVCVLCKDDMQ